MPNHRAKGTPSVKNFSSQKKERSQSEESCGRYGFPGFHRISVSTTARATRIGAFARIDSQKNLYFHSVWATECTKIAHRRSLATFTADQGIAENSAARIIFIRFHRRKNRGSLSLAIFFAEEIAHLGASKSRVIFPRAVNWEKLNPGVSKPGCFPLFSGEVQIVSRTLSGLFLVGALNRPRKRKRTNRENPRTIPEQIGKIPEKSGKSQKRTKKDKKGRTSPDRETPPFETPPFSGPWVKIAAATAENRAILVHSSERSARIASNLRFAIFTLRIFWGYFLEITSRGKK